MAALGSEYAAVIGSNAAVVGQVERSAEAVDEPVWELPLARDRYRKLLDSVVADMKNVGGPYAGATTAAIFLSEFVGDVPWAHLDIAGPMNVDGDTGWKSQGRHRLRHATPDRLRHELRLSPPPDSRPASAMASGGGFGRRRERRLAGATSGVDQPAFDVAHVELDRAPAHSAWAACTSVGQPHQVTLGDARELAPHRQPVRHRLGDPEHHAAVERLAERRRLALRVRQTHRRRGVLEVELEAVGLRGRTRRRSGA